MAQRRIALEWLGKLVGLGVAAQALGNPAALSAQDRTEKARASAGQVAWNLGEKADFPSLKRLDGSDVNWAAYRAKVLLIEFWATWCPFCARQNPLLDRLYRANRHRGLAAVTLSIDKNPETVLQYMVKHGYQFECGMLTPAWDSIYRHRKGLPQLYVFDRAGILRQIELREMLEEDIEDLVRYL